MIATTSAITTETNRRIMVRSSAVRGGTGPETRGTARIMAMPIARYTTAAIITLASTSQAARVPIIVSERTVNTVLIATNQMAAPANPRIRFLKNRAGASFSMSRLYGWPTGGRNDL